MFSIISILLYFTSITTFVTQQKKLLLNIKYSRKKVTIKKTYNENNQLIAEENATFYLYRDGELIDNITTDEMGEKVLFCGYDSHI